ncbi:MAG: ABC transporter ATP-binding protein, partial [Planctomycetota bacterium]
LMGVIKPDAGEIELGDFRGKRIGVKQKRGIGYVSQEQHFYPWMTCHGLGRFASGFYPTWDRNEYRRLLHVLDLPHNRKVAHLSGGMRVKLALAVALAHRPPILILDEPTSGLDPVARREFLNIIQQQARDYGRTTFFSSHLIDEVEQAADRIGIIKRGTLCYEGDITNLRQAVRRVPITEHQPLEQIVELGSAAGLEVLEAGAITNTQSVAMRGTPEQWAESAFHDENLHELPLEDLFISLVGEPTPNL